MTRPLVELPEVRRIADLARLELSPDELERMATELGAILAYVKDLETVDVADVPPMAHVGPMGAPWREDVPAPSLPVAEVLAEAPRARAGGFAVPAFVDGD